MRIVLRRDLFLQPAVDAVAAAELGVDRGLHLGGADDVLAGIGGELVGLLQQVDDRAQAGRQPVGIAGEPRGAAR